MVNMNLQFFGGRGASSGIGNEIRSGQRYENEYSNIFIKRTDSKKGTVRFIEGFSPSASHNAQEIPLKELKNYMKKYGFKMAGYYE
nr:MAG TPA: hypothetical protein [Caudoviricetes sp.]